MESAPGNRIMRSYLLAMLFLAGCSGAATAEGVFRREPPVISPGATVYVDNGRCSPGKILKVTAAFKGNSRKKTCVTLDPRDDS